MEERGDERRWELVIRGAGSDRGIWKIGSSGIWKYALFKGLSVAPVHRYFFLRKRILIGFPVFGGISCRLNWQHPQNKSLKLTYEVSLETPLRRHRSEIPQNGKVEEILGREKTRASSRRNRL
jgi:hypothetical protein